MKPSINIESDLYRVVHFEDETSTMAWIPEALVWGLSEVFPSMYEKEEGDLLVWDDENDMECVIHVYEGDDNIFSLEYMIYPDAEKFVKAFNEHELNKHTVAVIDLMVSGDEGKPVHAGEDCFHKIPDTVPIEQRFFVSGFASRLREDVKQKLRSDQVMSKPVDSDLFVSRILTALKIKLVD